MGNPTRGILPAEKSRGEFSVITSPLSQTGATHFVHAQIICPRKLDCIGAIYKDSILAKASEVLSVRPFLNLFFTN
jgi:hypothetical protein